LSQDLFKKWETMTGLNIYEGFGQTETTICCGTLYPFTEPHSSSMGMEIPGYDIALLDADGNKVPTGATGEICMKAEHPKPGVIRRPVGLFMGYYKNDEAQTIHGTTDISTPAILPTTMSKAICGMWDAMTML